MPCTLFYQTPYYAHDWRQANHAQALAYGRAYRAAHRDELNAKRRAIYWSDPEKARADSRASHARRRQAAKQYARWYYWQRPEAMRADARRRAIRQKLRILRGVTR